MKRLKNKLREIKPWHFLVAISFFPFFYFNFDPDLGWHLKSGELILKNQAIPYIDWFTHSFRNFPWINHEWLTDILMWKIYGIGGITLLAIFFWFVFAILTLKILKKSRKFNALILIGLIAFIPFLGIRPQVISWLFFYYFYQKVFVHEEPKKFTVREVLPIVLIFILWVNMHGSFVLGYFLIFVMAASVFIQKRFKIQLSDVFWHIKLSAILVLASFINPYGPRVYVEIYRTLIDLNLKGSISEWLPMFRSQNPLIYAYFVLVIPLILYFWKKLEVKEKLLIPLTILMGVSSLRYIPIMALVTLPLVPKITESLKNDLNPGIKKMIEGKVITVIYPIIIVLSLFLPSIPIKSALSEYPQKATEFIKENKFSGNLYNEYGWGGYLILNLPEKPVFIDGRMPSWKDGDRYVMEDYNNITRNPEKYFAKNIKKYDLKLFLIGSSQHLMISAVKNNGGKEIYKDDVAIVLKID